MNKERDASRLQEWYRLYAKLIYSYALSVVDMDVDTAAEIVQETFCKVLQKQEKEHVILDEIEYPKAWLLGIAKNTLRDWRRERDKRKLEVDLDAVPVDRLGASADAVNVELEYQGLVSDEDLRLLTLLEAEHRSCQETSEILGITVEACKKRRQRARMRMREKLEGSEK